MQSPKSQISPVRLRIERELPKLRSEKAAETATDQRSRRTLSISIAMGNLAKLRGKVKTPPAYIV
jgi:hypothetical protein